MRSGLHTGRKLLSNKVSYIYSVSLRVSCTLTNDCYFCQQRMDNTNDGAVRHVSKVTTEQTGSFSSTATYGQIVAQNILCPIVVPVIYVADRLPNKYSRVMLGMTFAVATTFVGIWAAVRHLPKPPYPKPKPTSEHDTWNGWPRTGQRSAVRDISRGKK